MVNVTSYIRIHVVEYRPFRYSCVTPLHGHIHVHMDRGTRDGVSELSYSRSRAVPIERETPVVVCHAFVAFGTGVGPDPHPNRFRTIVSQARAHTGCSVRGAFVNRDDRVARIDLLITQMIFSWD